MPSLISNTELKSELEAILPTCSRLTIISAFITQPATRWLSDLTTDNQPTVQLVGRFTPIDFINGASDFTALRDCINRGYTVSALNNLHAKIYQIDDDIIFTGSANLTGKGLALVNVSNLEACSRIHACEKSKSFIKVIVDSAITLTAEVINEMENYTSQISTTNNLELQMEWPEEIITRPDRLFVSDLPLSSPGSFVNEYQVNPSLPFAQIESIRVDFESASKFFKKSKAYRWLVKQIIENKSDRDLRFGQVSRLLHEALEDDPAPYRNQIKDLQMNLYSYLRLYAADEVKIYTPGKRSEIIKLIVDK
ncbi:MAG: phospholipase D-like domain-containing protein [Shewanella sp.]|nr:phospholipase D-like domain-containing protein [Shewanella sp.]